jgi:transporter family protein
MSTWLGWALLSAAFASLTAIFAKIGLHGVDADFATLLRTFVIVIVLTLFVLVTNKWSNPWQLSAKTLTFLTLSALATGASWVCYYRALQLGSASKVAPIDKLSVVLVALLAVAFLGERPSIKDWSAIGLVTAGVIILAL